MKTPKRALQEKQLHLICYRSLRAITLAYAMHHLPLRLPLSSPCLFSPLSFPSLQASLTHIHNTISVLTLLLSFPLDLLQSIVLMCFPTSTSLPLPLLNRPSHTHPYSGTELYLGTPHHCRHGLHRSPPPILKFPGPQPLLHTQTLAPCSLHSS
jgi:hypothetical protein